MLSARLRRHSRVNERTEPSSSVFPLNLIFLTLLSPGRGFAPPPPSSSKARNKGIAREEGGSLWWEGLSVLLGGQWNEWLIDGQNKQTKIIHTRNSVYLLKCRILFSSTVLTVHSPLPGLIRLKYVVIRISSVSTVNCFKSVKSA